MHRLRIEAVGFHWLAQTENTINGRRVSTRSRLKSLVLLAMAWAEGGNAGSDKKPGVIAVQIRLCHHGVRDVTRLPTLIKFIADLMTGGGRSLPGREGD